MISFIKEIYMMLWEFMMEENRLIQGGKIGFLQKMIFNINRNELGEEENKEIVGRRNRRCKDFQRRVL